MITVVVSTQADKSRVGMTWKVEIPDWAFEDWWSENLLVKGGIVGEFAHSNKGTFPGATTGIVIFRPNRAVEVHNFAWTMDEVGKFLSDADYGFPETDRGGPGRPEKRVLVSTTSKERRNGSMVARQVAY